MSKSNTTKTKSKKNDKKENKDSKVKVGTRARLVQNTCPKALGICYMEVRNLLLNLPASCGNCYKTHNSQIKYRLALKKRNSLC